MDFDHLKIWLDVVELKLQSLSAFTAQKTPKSNLDDAMISVTQPNHESFHCFIFVVFVGHRFESSLLMHFISGKHVIGLWK